MPHVVVVDDEPAIRGLAARWLEAAGYQPREAADADLALAEVESAPPGVVVTDLRMPGHDGFWLAEQVRRAAPDTAILVATACDDLPSAVRSLKLGVFDYLLKPFTCEELQSAVRRGMRWHASRASSRLLSKALAGPSGKAEAFPAASMTVAQMNEQGSIEALVAMLEAWNQQAAAHAQRTAAIATRLADMLGVTEPKRSDLQRAALLHEVAMVGWPGDPDAEPANAAPDAPPALPNAPEQARDWLKLMPSLAGAASIVGSMDEWFDGSGEPENRLAGEIPITSRILAVADEFDGRRYPRRRSPVDGTSCSVRDALVAVSGLRGSRFDPNVIDALVKQQTVN